MEQYKKQMTRKWKIPIKKSKAKALNRYSRNTSFRGNSIKADKNRA
jgi:hypothetical protein